jgi:hypothetical protein
MSLIFDPSAFEMNAEGEIRVSNEVRVGAQIAYVTEENLQFYPASHFYYKEAPSEGWFFVFAIGGLDYRNIEFGRPNSTEGSYSSQDTALDRPAEVDDLSTLTADGEYIGESIIGDTLSLADVGPDHILSSETGETTDGTTNQSPVSEDYHILLLIGIVLLFS